MNDQATMILPDGWTPLQGLASIVAQMLDAERPADTPTVVGGGQSPTLEPPLPAVLACMTTDATRQLQDCIPLAVEGHTSVGDYHQEDTGAGFCVAVFPRSYYAAVVSLLGKDREQVVVRNPTVPVKVA